MPVFPASRSSMAQSGFTALEGQADPLVQAQIRSLNGGQALMDVRVHLVVLLPQNLSVVGIGADTLDSEEDGVLQREDIGVLSGIGFQADRLGLLDQFGQEGGGHKRRSPVGKIDLAAGGFYLRLEPVAFLRPGRLNR